MKKYALTTVVFLILLSVLVFSTPQQEETGPITLQFSTSAAPTTGHAKAQAVFKEEIERLTNGRIQVEVFVGSELHTQEAQQSAVRKGTLDMTYGDPNWFAEFVPYMSMLAAAYFFKDYEHMTTVLNGEIGKEIYDDMAETMGVRPLGAYFLGTRNINLRDIGREVRVPADLKGVKLRMPNSPSWLFMGRALGANPTPISISELYLALKTGTVDGQDNPIPGTIVRKFYEVTKYYILTGHYVNPIMPVINEKKWQSLGPDLQEKMYAAIDKAREFCDKTILEEEASGAGFLREQGMIVYEVDKSVWAKHVQEYYLNDEEMTSTWDMELYNKIQAMAK